VTIRRLQPGDEAAVLAAGALFDAPPVPEAHAAQRTYARAGGRETPVGVVAEWPSDRTAFLPTRVAICRRTGRNAAPGGTTSLVSSTGAREGKNCRSGRHNFPRVIDGLP
jgi:hypothetical protein